MILGHSAALAASMAIDANCAVQDIDRANTTAFCLKTDKFLKIPEKNPLKNKYADL